MTKESKEPQTYHYLTERVLHNYRNKRGLCDDLRQLVLRWEGNCEPDTLAEWLGNCYVDEDILNMLFESLEIQGYYKNEFG